MSYVFEENDYLYDTENKNIIIYCPHELYTVLSGVPQRLSTATPITITDKVLTSIGFVFNNNINCYEYISNGNCISVDNCGFSYKCNGSVVKYLNDIQQIYRHKYNEELLVDIDSLLSVL